MKPLYQHELLNSFYLWFDNYLMKKGEAYPEEWTKEQEIEAIENNPISPVEEIEDNQKFNQESNSLELE